MAITWTKLFSSSDDGLILTGSHVGNIQADIASKFAGGITNADISSSAAIAEAKIAFDTTSGHTHNGTDSRLLATSSFVSKHYRSGCFIRRASASTLTVTAGHLDIGGTVYNKTTSTTLTMSSSGDFAGGGSEQATAAHFIYGFNNSGVLGFKLANSAPNLSDTDSNTAEEPWRYRDFSGTKYRCVGAIYNNAASDLEPYSEVNFDASNVVVGKIVGSGSDQTVTTIWTPDEIRTYVPGADPPAAAGAMIEYVTNRQLLTDFSIVARPGNETFVAAATDGVAKTITAQAAGTAGSFVIDSFTSGFDLYYIASTRERF